MGWRHLQASALCSVWSGREMMELLLEFLDGGGVPVISLVTFQL